MRIRYAKTAVAALTCAMLAVPAGAAYAGSGPAPKPSERSAAKSTAPSAEGNPNSRLAEAAGVCDDAYQIGTTGYVKRSGVTIASVKQFYSPDCKENYGYVWVWESFRKTAGDYDVTAAVYSYSQDEVLGTRAWTNTTRQEFWSHGTDTVSECTAGVGSVRKAGDPVPNNAASSKRC
ncbi:hypothetical protein [Streptomyces sp. HNM0575]|uniref:hypothetical protein n=1 Tax=Streptomyces sp. HNM0575 TaxID=2716338 RepID=UPI0019D29C8A|nr:hypothetical protein [Streptomyces sp. HNM0575]